MNEVRNFVVLLVIALILLLTGCTTTEKGPWRDGRVIIYDRQVR